MSIDLLKVKERKSTILNLKKDTGLENQAAQVILALDYSGSMSNLYRNGSVQEVVERILPLGLAFDDNQAVDFYLFEDDYTKLPENITLKNVDGYIKEKVLGNYTMGGTSYAPVLEAIYDDFVKTKGGFFGLGGKVTTMELPVYIIFITDGENSDKDDTREIVRKMSNAGFFIQFIGIGNESFNFLSKLDDLSGRLIDNANFFKVPNLQTVSDDDLYRLLMKEFPLWVKQAKSKELIA